MSAQFQIYSFLCFRAVYEFLDIHNVRAKCVPFWAMLHWADVSNDIFSSNLWFHFIQLNFNR